MNKSKSGKLDCVTFSYFGWCIPLLNILLVFMFGTEYGKHEFLNC